MSSVLSRRSPARWVRVRLSLGGVRERGDAAATDVGALPGRVIRSMKKAGTVNPVMMLDEVDKLGCDFPGDPRGAALLEVLDPEQNNTFSDHYLESGLRPLQGHLIATANQLDPIPAAPRPHGESSAGYTFEEKCR